MPGFRTFRLPGFQLSSTFPPHSPLLKPLRGTIEKERERVSERERRLLHRIVQRTNERDGCIISFSLASSYYLFYAAVSKLLSFTRLNSFDYSPFPIESQIGYFNFYRHFVVSNCYKSLKFTFYKIGSVCCPQNKWCHHRHCFGIQEELTEIGVFVKIRTTSSSPILLSVSSLFSFFEYSAIWIANCSLSEIPADWKVFCFTHICVVIFNFP